MSRAVFVDTGGWVALQVADDRWHSAARQVLESLVRRRTPLVTSNLVVGETYTLLRVKQGADAAWRFADTLARSQLLTVEHVTFELEEEAWALLRRFRDQPFSFVDGASFALMKQLRLKQALAFDAHFQTAGFARLGIDATAS